MYILTDYQIKTYAIRNLYIYNAVFISHWGTTFRGRPFWHQIHYKKHLILRYIFLSCQYKYLFCSFKYHLWRWRVLKNENIFISYNTDMNYNDIYSKTITALCCTNCQSQVNSCLKLNQQHWGECSFQTHRWPGTGLSSPKWGWQHMCTTHQSFASFVYRVR